MAGASKLDLALAGLADREKTAPARFLELAIEWVSQDGERVLRAGGRFDSHAKRYVGAPSEVVTITLNSTQLEPAHEFADWLASHILYRREIAAGQTPAEARQKAWPDDDWIQSWHYYGGSRCGKSVLGVLAVLAYGVAVPGSRIFLVPPTDERAGELLLAFQEFCPSSWRRWSASDRAFQLANGSRVECHTAGSKNLKKGRADFVLINEAQECKYKSVSDARVRTTDRGGASILTYNPPRSLDGQWLQREWDEIDAGEHPRYRAHYFDWRLNEYVDHAALLVEASRMTELERRREIDGDMSAPVIDVVFPGFYREHVREWIPPGWRDVTREVTGDCCGYEAQWLVGLDFDKGAGCSWALAKVYRGDYDGNTADRLVFVNGHRERDFEEWQLDERMRAMSDHRGAEIVADKKQFLCVADASAFFEAVEKRSDPDQIKPAQRLISKGWHVIRPQADSKRNPLTANRFNLARRLLRDDRVFFMRSATELVDDVRHYPTMSTGEPKRKHPRAHLNDAWTYLAYRLFAERDAEKQVGGRYPVRIPRRPPTY